DDAVTDIPWREEIAFNAVRNVGAADGAHGAIALVARPLAESLGAFASEETGNRRRDPARLQRVRRVSAATDQTQAMGLAGCDKLGVDDFIIVPRAIQLVARLTGHAVTQRADGLAVDHDVRHVEELERRRLGT